VRFASDELNRTYDREGLPTSVVDIPRTLEHLARNGFLEVERDPAGWTGGSALACAATSRARP